MEAPVQTLFAKRAMSQIVEGVGVADRGLEDGVGRVNETEVDASGRWHAGGLQLAVVGDSLVTQWVELVDGDDVRWEPGEVLEGREVGPGEWIAPVGVVGVVAGDEDVHHRRVDEPAVVFDQ